MVTHQKRTMEIADALYGVTMRGDGVTTVISQRLRDDEAGDRVFPIRLWRLCAVCRFLCVGR